MIQTWIMYRLFKGKKFYQSKTDLQIKSEQKYGTNKIRIDNINVMDDNVLVMLLSIWE